MGKSYKPITSMKEVPEQLRKLRRQYLRYQQAEIIYSISNKKLLELASDAGAIYRIDGTVLINKNIFDTFHKKVIWRCEKGHEWEAAVAYDMTSFRVQTEVSASPTFFGWVFGFNGKVQILAPESVKEQYRQMIAKANEDMQENE